MSKGSPAYDTLYFGYSRGFYTEHEGALLTCAKQFYMFEYVVYNIMRGLHGLSCRSTQHNKAACFTRPYDIVLVNPL